jgi:hypothetical protein
MLKLIIVLAVLALEPITELFNARYARGRTRAAPHTMATLISERAKYILVFWDILIRYILSNILANHTAERRQFPPTREAEPPEELDRPTASATKVVPAALEERAEDMPAGPGARNESTAVVSLELRPIFTLLLDGTATTFLRGPRPSGTTVGKNLPSLLHLSCACCCERLVRTPRTIIVVRSRLRFPRTIIHGAGRAAGAPLRAP